MPAVNELEIYVIAETSEAEVDVLDWRKAHEREFPHLAKMAKDYLAIPETSTRSERAFSVRKTLLTYYRGKLSPSSIEACMCLKIW